MELILEDDQGRLAIRDFLVCLSNVNQDSMEDDNSGLLLTSSSFTPDFDLAQVLIGINSGSCSGASDQQSPPSTPPVSAEYSARVLGFFRRMFELALEEPGEGNGGKLTLHGALKKSVATLSERNPKEIRRWIKFLLQGNFFRIKSI